MISLEKLKFAPALCALAVLAACDAAPHQTAKAGPKTALECRQDIYKNPSRGSAVIATGGGLSAGASIAIALVSGAASSAVANDANVRRLNACYDAVGAHVRDRLPLDTATKRHDDILMAGGSASEARRSIVQSARGGPNGGVGFSNF